MKRIVTLLLAAGLVLGAAAGSQAADIKAKGTWDFMVQFGDQSALKHDGQDTMSAMQRLRTQVDVIASESLKGVMFFEIGSTNWGQSNQGGALGTDGRQVEVRYSYIDWVIPQTEVKVRVGLQNFTLPNFVAGSAILGGGAADGAGITIAGDFTENVGASLFWLRAENDNVGYDSKKDYKASDAFDVVGLTVPLTFDGVKVTPWGMFSMIGKDSLDGNHADSRDQIGTLRTGLTPIGMTSFSGSKDRNGNAWWLGLGGELTMFNPVRVAVDAAYGSADMGENGARINGKEMDLKRSGWYASIIGEYKLDFMTPGLLFWYASGDDNDYYNGSERLPTIRGSWSASSYGFDGNYYDSNCDVIGLTPVGTMAVFAQIKDISFLEDLSHVFRAGYIKGTNNTEMARHGYGVTPFSTSEGLYLTTGDSAIEVNFDTEYKIYKDLTLFVELGYINLDLGDTWKQAQKDSVRENNFRGAVNLEYKF